MSNDAAYAAIRKELEGERDALRSQMDELGGGESPLDYDANFADTSQVTAERGENANLVQSLGESLASVEAALGRLESGTFGSCEKCGKAIAPARLEAQPTATRCIECASA